MGAHTHLFSPKIWDFYSRNPPVGYRSSAGRLRRGDVFYTYGWRSEKWAVSNTAAGLNVWFEHWAQNWWYSSIRLSVRKTLWTEERSVCCGVSHVKKHTAPAPPWALHIQKPTLTVITARIVQKFRFFSFLNQCLGCLIQFRMIHFWPEHLCTTRRKPKLASLDISTSKHRPVSLLIIGPFWREQKRKGENQMYHYSKTGSLLHLYVCYEAVF